MTRADAVNTWCPWRFCATCTGSAAVPAAVSRAARTCASRDMSVLRNTRLMSGCAISRPCASTT